MKKGGSAKGELVLAIFELGNCFRHAWGVGKDPVAAREYYETAANLGDADAQNEVAWCYVEGFGCKKDKVSILSPPPSPLLCQNDDGGDLPYLTWADAKKINWDLPGFWFRPPF